jgi:hypothetical protein
VVDALGGGHVPRQEREEARGEGHEGEEDP